MTAKRDQVVLSIRPEERKEIERIKSEHRIVTDQEVFWTGVRKAFTEPDLDRQRKLDEEVEIRRRLGER